MEIELHEISVRDIFAGYENNEATGQVVAYNGKLNPGTLICILEGSLKYVTVKDCPDAVICQITEDNPNTSYTDSAICMLLTPDMYLEAPVSGTDAQIEGLLPGEFVGYTGTSVNAATTSAYCQVIDTFGAKKAGDKILVRFINNNNNNKAT